MCTFSAGAEYDPVVTLGPLLRLLRSETEFGEAFIPHVAGIHEIQGATKIGAAGVGMAFETHGSSDGGGPITAGYLHLYTSFGGLSHATLPYYLEKRERC